MICNWYSIAGKKVRICQDWDMPIPMFEGFETEPWGSADVSAECYEGNRNFEGAYGVEYYKCNTDMPHLFFSKESRDVRLTASSDWSQMVIEGCKNRMTGVMEVFLAAFYSFLTEQGGVLAHASLIRMERGCVMFSGPSGIGKTTQAKLWNMYKAAEILNGDKVILLPKEEEIEAWGSPWRGSSSYGKNKQGILKAVVVLEQGSRNSIRKLSSGEIAERFFPHVFYPFWDGKCVQRVLETLEQLQDKVPVYELSCLPDEHAVALAYHEIWGDTEH